MTLTWKPPRLPNKPVAVFSNTAEYAAIVHNGATLRSGVELPPREFMTGAFGEKNDFDAERYFVSQYNDSLSKAFRSTASQANREIKLLIKSPVWSWPRETIRSRGRTVRSPRDIRDTSELLKSQQPVRYES